MANKPLKKSQTVDLDQSIQIALDAADASMDVTAEFERISAQFSETADSAARLEKSARIGVMAAGAIALVAVILMGAVWQRSSSGLERLAATNTELLAILTENIGALEESIAPVKTLEDRLVALDARLADVQLQIADVAENSIQINDLRTTVAQITVDIAGLESRETASERADGLGRLVGDRIATLNGEFAMNVSTAVQDALSLQMENHQGLVEDMLAALKEIDGGVNASAVADLQKKMDSKVNDLTMRLNQMKKARAQSVAPRKVTAPQPDIIKFP